MANAFMVAAIDTFARSLNCRTTWSPIGTDAKAVGTVTDIYTANTSGTGIRRIAGSPDRLLRTVTCSVARQPGKGCARAQPLRAKKN